ncbi:MAG: tetratricopeptide repeat protein [Candidatus Poribacteria bacterium]|nr:tetratricopeptide repeat protein [Candidatus Poribacteria bacterium]
MRKFIIVEICVVIAIALGFWLGRITSPFNDYAHYYENADKAMVKAQQMDSPPVSFDEPDKSRLRKVRAAYRAVFDNYPDSRWADDAIYQLASRLPRTDEEGFALFRRLIREYPDSEYADDSMYAVAYATYEIARELQKSGTLESPTAYYDRALALFNQLIATYPGSVLQEEAQLNAALCYFGRGDVSIALSELINLKMELREHPIRYRILYVLGDIYFQQQDYENAQIEYLNVADSGDPVYAPKASFHLARVYFAEGLTKETEASYMEIKGDTEEAEAMYKEAEAKYNQAIDGYQEVIDDYSDTASGQDARFYIAWAYEKTKKYDEAISHLEYAIENYPDNESATTAKYYIGQLAHANGDIARAIEVYQNFADDPSHDYDSRLQAQYRIGKIYEEIEDIEQAIVAYEKFLIDFPEPHRLPEHESRKITENYVQKLKSGDVDEE